MLLTNWLNTLTSRIRKRRVFRSRDRRDIRRRWQSIVKNQISTTEALEDRTLLTTVFDQGELLAPAGTAPHDYDEAGHDVAVDGDWMVVGARLADPISRHNAGAVYLYSRNDSSTPLDQSDDTWDFHSTLTSPLIIDPSVENDVFGFTVDIDGDTLIVGAVGAADGETPGSAYIFTKEDPNSTPEDLSDDVWNFRKTLSRPADLANSFNQQFGYSVAISGDTAVVGASTDDLGGLDNSGAVYVFSTENDWNDYSVNKLKAEIQDDNALFGHSVAIDGDASTIIIGAHVDLDRGAVYLFERVENGAGIADDTWDEVKKVSGIQAGSAFGISVDIDGGIAVVGVQGFDLESTENLEDVGVAYVLDHSADWGIVGELNSPSPAEFDYFGHAVAISGDRIIVGSWLDDSTSVGSGAAYLFDREEGWAGAVARIDSQHNTSGDQFGWSVDISDASVIVGAIAHDHGDTNTGGAFAYALLNDPDNVGSFDGSDFTLNSSTNSNTNITISEAGGVITITDPGAYLQAPAGATQVDEHTFTFTLGDIPGGTIYINGGTGDDNLIVDSSLALAGISVVYDGGSGGGFDSLEVTGSATDVEYVFDNLHDGKVRLNGSGNNFITYTGLEPIASPLNATNVTLSYSGVGETITVTDAGSGQTTVTSTSGETITFDNPTGTLTINAGDGTDIIDINSLAANFSGNLVINGEAGVDDVVNLNSSISFNAGRSLTVNSERVAVKTGFTVTAAGIEFNAETVDLDGDLIGAVSGDSNTVVVFGSAGGADLQDAVNIAGTGSNIYVSAGTYLTNGSLLVNEEVSIIGEGSDVVEIRKSGAPTGNYDEAISITANNVTISGAQLGWEIHTSATDYQGYVVTTTADHTTLNNLYFDDNYRSAVVFQNADYLEVSDSIFAGFFSRAAIRDGNGGSGEHFLITRNEFREDHYRWGPIAIGPQGTDGDPNNFAFSGEISFNYFANGLQAGNFQGDGDQNYTVTITNQGMTADGLNIIHNTFDWQDASTVNGAGNYAQSAGVYIDPDLSISGPVNITDNIFTGFTYEGPQPSTDPLWGATGVFGTALEFDGVDDYGFFESALFDVGTTGTLNFWVNMDDQSRRNQFFEGLDGLGFEFQYRENSNGQFFGTLERVTDPDDNFTIQLGNANGTTGVWQNLQYTWNFNGGVSPEMHIYIDGSEVAYLPGYDSSMELWETTVSTVSQLITVGKDAGTGKYFDGKMDDIGWFNAVLDSTARDNIRNNGVAALAADPRLVAHWDFDETSGTTAVDNKNGIVMHIVADGIPPFGPEFQETGGKFGGALEFDGVDDFATFQSENFDVGETGTLNFWVNMDDQSRRNQFFEGLDGVGFEFQYRENSGGQFFGTMERITNPDYNFVIQSGNASGTTGVWQNLQYTWNYNGGVSPEMHIYLDGTEVAYRSGFDSSMELWQTTVSTVSQMITVGQDAGGGRNFDGLMDDIAWFDDVLSQTERDLIRSNSVGGSALNGDPRLVAYWNLDDTAGTTVVSGDGGTNIDLLLQQKPALPPVQGVGVIAPSGVNLTNNIFTGNDLDSNLTLDPSNQTGTLDLLYAKDSDPLYISTESLAEQYRIGFGSPAAYLSSDIAIDPATPFPHIGAYQGFPGYYGTGDILIYGTNDNDLLDITFNTANEATFTFTRDVGGPGEFTEGPVILTGITSFTFYGLEGDDTLRITNPGGGLVNPVNGITYHGGTGGQTTGDTLEILGGVATSVLHTFENANDGSVSFNGETTATITYTGLEPISDTIAAGNRTFSYLGGAEAITLSDFGGANDDVSVISSTLGEAVNFNHNTLTSITIITTDGSGADTVNINSVDGNFSSNLTVTAGTDDTINTGTVDIGSGALDLTGGQVNVNGAFTTTGSVDIDSTFGNIHFAAAGSIDAGTSEIDLTAASNVNSLNVTTTTEVRVTASAGGINDLTGNAQITADRVALRAGTGGITDIATTVNTLAASATDGGFNFDNTGDLEIGSVDSLDGITANSSTIFVTATGALTVTQAVSAETIGYLRAVDAVSAGQDINVNAGITTTSGDLNLQAGDNLNLATGVTLNSAAFMIISIDSTLGGTPDAAGGVANLNGILQAGSNITVNGGTQADQVIIDSNGGTASDGGNVEGVQALFNFVGSGGADQLILDDSGDSSGDVISISSTGPGLGAVAGAGLAALGFNFNSPSTITLNTGTDTDVISVELGNGSPDVNITSAGGTDSLTVLGRASGDDLLVATPGAVGTGSGTILDLGFPKTIDFDGITGPILIDGRGSATTDLVTVFGTAGIDTTTIGPSGPVLLTEIDPTLVTIGVQNIDVLAVDTDDGEDVIEVSPDLNIAIDINGGDPTAPASPGDSLIYLTPSGQGSNYTPTGTDSGTITATGGFQAVTFDEIETVTLGGSVTVTGTAADDVLTITATSFNAGTYQIVSGGVPGPVININSITDFTFNGGDGNDTLIIDNFNIASTPGTDLFNPSGGIFFNGEGNTAGGDSLQILGGDATTVEHRFTSANDGSIYIDGAGTATITYTGLEPIQDDITATDRIFSFLGGAEVITLSDDGFAGNGKSTIGSTLGESVTFTHPSGTVTINTELLGGSGIDAVNIQGLDSTFNANLTVNAGIDDTTTFQTNATNIGAGNLAVNSGNVVFDQDVTTTGNAVINATGGSITDGGSSAADELSAATAVMTATADVGGAGDALDINVNNLEADAGGIITINSTGATPLTIGGIGPVVGLEADNGIDLYATGQLIIAEAIENLNNLISIESADSITQTATVNANNGNIAITASGSILLASLIASVGTIDVLSTTDEILDNNGGGYNAVTTNARFRGFLGVGTGGNFLETFAGTIVGGSAAGGFYIDSDLSVNLGGGSFGGGITAAGEIIVLSSSDIDVEETVESTGSFITLDSDSDINVNSTVQTNGGAIDLLADNDLNLGATSLIDTTIAAVVTLTADSDTS
uniref:LamG-like jellyroll fold domain-containing protein n=1 Tax=Gimesia sp. TaxID=2024833 RepID=UPI003A91A19C